MDLCITVSIGKPPALPKQKNKLWRRWTTLEIEAVMKHLGHRVSTFTLPKKEEIDEALKEEPCLGRRTWRNVKDYVRNQIELKKTHMSRKFGGDT